MKKILLALLIGTATLGTLSSCTKEYYEMVPSISVIYTREAKDWNTKDPQSAYLDLNVPELTNYYVKQGVVNIAISFDGEKNIQCTSCYDRWNIV